MLPLIAAQTPALDVVLTGTVQPQVQSPFGFRVMGRMIARPVKAGDRVEAGQLLAAADPLSLEMASRSAWRPWPAPAPITTTPSPPRRGKPLCWKRRPPRRRLSTPPNRNALPRKPTWLRPRPAGCRRGFP